MSNERIDLKWLLEEDGLMQDLNWSIARFEQVEKLVKEMTAELKKSYEEIDNLVKEKNRLIDIAERCGAWEGNFDFSDINDEYGACNICGSIPSGCCEASE